MTVTTKCDTKLLESVAGITTAITNCDRVLSQSATGITKCDNYNKARRNTVS